jgi:hypothetical protein
MSTTLAESTTRPSHLRQIAAAGGIAAAASAVLAVALAAIASALDVPLEVVMAGATDPEQIPIAAFAIASLLAVGVGTLLALALDRWVGRAAQVFVGVAVVATVLSFVPVLGVEGASDATKVVLALAHVVVAAVAIPLIGRALARTATQ